MPRTPLLALIAAAGLTGCTETAHHYPSLLPRPIESQSLAEPAASPAPVATPDAALDTRIAELVATLDKAAADFTAIAQNAEARIAVARGLPPGSDGWLDAQAALSEVGAARAPVGTTLAELERLTIDRGAAGLPPYPALDAAVARANALADAQAARNATLEAALTAP